MYPLLDRCLRLSIQGMVIQVHIVQDLQQNLDISILAVAPPFDWFLKLST